MFVFKGTILCVSQYNHYCSFPRLLERFGAARSSEKHEELKRGLSSFQKRVHELLMQENAHRDHYQNGYLLDIGVIELGGLLDYTVIELNPYHSTTGAALFRWTEV